MMRASNVLINAWSPHFLPQQPFYSLAGFSRQVPAGISYFRMMRAIAPDQLTDCLKLPPITTTLRADREMNIKTGSFSPRQFLIERFGNEKPAHFAAREHNPEQFRQNSATIATR